MSQIKQSVVTLKVGVDVDAFIDEMTGAGATTQYVPSRRVEIYDIRPLSLRNVEFLLTGVEAEQLKLDSRVEAVRWGTKFENGIVNKASAIKPAILTYSRSSSYVATDKSDINWGLLDCYSTDNPFTSDTNIIGNRIITLTGQGVDVVIMDSGLQIDHPEFKYANGVSRVQTINWWTAAGQGGNPPWTQDATQNNMPSGFYTDYNGHGTNVGSIAAGRNYGWATDANIYVMNVLGENGIVSATNSNPTVITTAFPHGCSNNDTIYLTVQKSWGSLAAGTTITPKVTVVSNTVLSLQGVDSSAIGPYTPYNGRIALVQSGSSIRHPGAISTTLAFDLIRQWHTLKPLNPSTGYRRPTVVNCSFTSTFGYINNVTGGNYHGTTTWSGGIGSASANTYGMIKSTDGLYPIISSTDKSSIQDAVAAGVIFIAAAGNNSYKIDISTGADYNNYANGSFTTSEVGNVWYYQRGATPGAVDGVVCVGAIDYTYNANPVNSLNHYIGYPSYSTANATAKAYFSACGPRIDLYAPGGMVAGATSSAKLVGTYSTYPVTTYYANPSFNQQKDSGTSQASPQVAGVIACVVEANPNFKAGDVGLWLSQNSVSSKLANIATSGTNPYQDQFNLQGSPDKYLYMPYQTTDIGDVTGAANITGGIFNL